MDKKIIAIAYDFDGTLTAQPMQEYTVFKHFNINPKKFWDHVNKDAEKSGADPMLNYMRLLIDVVQQKKGVLTYQNLIQGADKISYFKGVLSWFKRINQYVDEQSNHLIEVRHYVISCGNREIVESTKIASEFHRIYASAYHFDANGVADFPAVLVTDATKPQFLFRINKGKEDLHQSVNEHMAPANRPIPFSQILYLGDGLTDVPCMAVARQNGGHAIAVYDPANIYARDICHRLWDAGRADFTAAADYTENSFLDQRVKLLLDLKIANIRINLEHPSLLQGRQ